MHGVWLFLDFLLFLALLTSFPFFLVHFMVPGTATAIDCDCVAVHGRSTVFTTIRLSGFREGLEGTRAMLTLPFIAFCVSGMGLLDLLGSGFWDLSVFFGFSFL